MSVIQFLNSGGMASVGGDLPKEEQDTARTIAKDFTLKVKENGLSRQIPASFLHIKKCAYLLVGKDIANFYFVFADTSGSTQIYYRDFSSHGRLELQSIVHSVRLEVGEPVWAFSCPLNLPKEELERHIKMVADEYINTILETQRKNNKQISVEALNTPDIASGLEKFRADYPIGTKTAFIIMQFGKTNLHDEIVQCIKDTLHKHKIIGLRADDKEYMDDLFHNIKTYMYGCDFGIGVYERITEENFNPNVSLEVGYMMGMEKKVLLLKDKNLKALQTDLAGKLYKQFDPNNITETLPKEIDKWLIDKGYISK